MKDFFPSILWRLKNIISNNKYVEAFLPEKWKKNQLILWENDPKLKILDQKLSYLHSRGNIGQKGQIKGYLNRQVPGTMVHCTLYLMYPHIINIYRRDK